MKLNIEKVLPDNFFELLSDDLWKVFPGPTLIHITGKNPEPLFISTLLHGNEDSGFYALQKVLSHFSKGLPRDLLIFLGNPEAAKYNRRHLDDQPDFNRIWHEDVHSEETAFAMELLDILKTHKLFACVDIHNNTGRNPHYSCVNYLDPKFFSFAKLFSDKVVYFKDPKEALSIACGQFTPSLTLECGLPGDSMGAQHAYEFIKTLMELDELPNYRKKYDYYEVVAKIKIPTGVHFDIGEGPGELSLPPGFDKFNFQVLPIGSCIAKRAHGSNAVLAVVDKEGNDIFDDFVNVDSGEIVTVKHVIPSMFTMNKKIIQQDCLGYFMVQKSIDLS